MAIDICSEIPSTVISPRISFSHDLNRTDNDHDQDQHRRLDSSLLDSTSDFDFGIGGNNYTSNNFLQELSLSSADELFSNGKIRPVQIKQQQQKRVIPPQQPNTCTHRNVETAEEKKIQLKEFLSMSLDSEDDEDNQTEQIQNCSSKSLPFWQFKRSNSLNCESTRTKSLIRSLHFLSRSNSTGSAPFQKPPPIAKDTPKQSFQRQASTLRKSSSSSSSSSSTGTTYYFYSSPSTKPPLLRKSGSYNGNGVRINPVLNIPPPFVSNATGNLFSFCSNFCNGKIKKKKKR